MRVLWEFFEILRILYFDLIYIKWVKEMYLFLKYHCSYLISGFSDEWESKNVVIILKSIFKKNNYEINF